MRLPHPDDERWLWLIALAILLLICVAVKADDEPKPTNKTTPMLKHQGLTKFPVMERNMADKNPTRYAKRIKIVEGMRFGKLTVLGFHEFRSNTSNRARYWKCVCDCGNTKVLKGARLTTGNVKSCGCIWKTHGHTCGGELSPTFITWMSMRQRCNSVTCRTYQNYGGRGIRICERWDSFENFLEDMGQKPSPKHSIDRIDVNGNYELGNCRWATRTEQNRNRRSIIPITFYGKTLSLTEWSNISQVHWSAIYGRLRRGWSEKEAVWTPAGTTKRRMSR